MVRILSIQRAGTRGVVQFVGPRGADALAFDARLSDAEVLRLLTPPKAPEAVAPVAAAPAAPVPVPARPPAPAAPIPRKEERHARRKKGR